MSHLIDVIVPVYNTEAYLPACVDSLLAQDFVDFSITLVDDGSIDGSGALCDGYAAGHPDRVRTIHQPNAGLSAARNAGVAASQAEWVTFVDADDHVSPRYLSALYGALTDSGADMAAGRICTETPRPDGGVSHRLYPAPDSPLMDRDRALAVLCLERSGGIGGFACGKLLRRSCALASPFPPGRFFEDSFTVWRQVMDCRRLAYAPDAVYYYLQRPGSIQRRAFDGRHMDLIDAVEEMIGVFEAEKMPAAVLAAGAYKVCRSCYVTAFHAVELPYGDFCRVYGQLRPLLRRYRPALRGLAAVSGKERLLFRLLAASPRLFYGAVKLLSEEKP